MSDDPTVGAIEDGMESAIAIVGMSGRFPDARNVHEYWTNLRDGRESVSALSDEQLRDLIDEGLDSHLIEEVSRSPNRYQFIHALVQEPWRKN